MTPLLHMGDPSRGTRGADMLGFRSVTGTRFDGRPTNRRPPAPALRHAPHPPPRGVRAATDADRSPPKRAVRVGESDRIVNFESAVCFKQIRTISVRRVPQGDNVGKFIIGQKEDNCSPTDELQNATGAHRAIFLIHAAFGAAFGNPLLHPAGRPRRRYSLRSYPLGIHSPARRIPSQTS